MQWYCIPHFEESLIKWVCAVVEGFLRMTRKWLEGAAGLRQETVTKSFTKSTGKRADGLISVSLILSFSKFSFLTLFAIYIWRKFWKRYGRHNIIVKSILKLSQPSLFFINGPLNLICRIPFLFGLLRPVPSLLPCCKVFARRLVSFSALAIIDWHFRRGVSAPWALFRLKGRNGAILFSRIHRLLSLPRCRILAARPLDDKRLRI